MNLNRFHIISLHSYRVGQVLLILTLFLPIAVVGNTFNFPIGAGFRSMKSLIFLFEGHPDSGLLYILSLTCAYIAADHCIEGNYLRQEHLPILPLLSLLSAIIFGLLMPQGAFKIYGALFDSLCWINLVVWIVGVLCILFSCQIQRHVSAEQESEMRALIVKGQPTISKLFRRFAQFVMGSVITHYQCLYFKFGVFSLLVWAPIALMAILFLIIAIVVGNISLNALLIFIALFIFLLPYPLYLFFLYRWGRRWTERTRIQSIYYLVPLLPIALLVLFSSLGQSKWFRPKPHWADTETFEWLDNGYSKDIHHAYHDSTVIEGADPATFRVLDYHYAADAYHVFFKLRMIPEADPSSFKVLPLMNKGEEDKARTIYLARDAHDYYVRDIPLHVADYRSFRRIKNKWAVDNQKVYYFGRESEKFDVICSPVFDSRNFHVLSYCFASDGHYVYHEGTIIEGADPATFKVVGNDNNISQDKNHVYYATEKRPLRNVYALKHKSEFLYESFHTNDTIVYNPKLQPMPEGTDYATIHDIGTDWYADKDRVYYENRIVPEADPQTFESCHAYSILKDTVIRIKHGHRVYGIYAHDAKHIYRRDTILEVADTATFVCGRSFVDTLRFAFDKYRFYEGHPTPAIEKLRKRLIAP